MKIRVLSFCLLISAAFPLIASAAPIPLPPVWPTTWVNVVDDPNMTPTPSMYPESYVATQNEIGMITDLFVVGDSYTVFVNGIPVLTTPAVPTWTADGCSGPYDPNCFTTDPNVAWGNPIWSQGTFDLNAGDIVTIQEDNIPSGFTDGTYAITAMTPEPGTLGLLGSGLLGLMGALRRRFGNRT